MNNDLAQAMTLILQAADGLATFGILWIVYNRAERRADETAEILFDYLMRRRNGNRSDKE